MKTRQHKQIHPAANRRTPGQIFIFFRPNAGNVCRVFNFFYFFYVFSPYAAWIQISTLMPFSSFCTPARSANTTFAVTFLNFRHALTFGGCTAPRCPSSRSDCGFLPLPVRARAPPSRRHCAGLKNRSVYLRRASESSAPLIKDSHASKPPPRSRILTRRLKRSLGRSALARRLSLFTQDVTQWARGLRDEVLFIVMASR